MYGGTGALASAVSQTKIDCDVCSPVPSAVHELLESVELFGVASDCRQDPAKKLVLALCEQLVSLKGSAIRRWRDELLKATSRTPNDRLVLSILALPKVSYAVKGGVGCGVEQRLVPLMDGIKRTVVARAHAIQSYDELSVSKGLR
jgi:hypothetical protein